MNIASIILVSNTAKFINTNQQIDFVNIEDAFFTGDSIMAGANADPSSLSYREKIITEHGWNQTNLSSSGRGVWLEVSAILARSFTLNDVIMLSAGLNDIRRSSTVESFNKIESCLYSCLCNAFIGSAVAGGNASVVRADGTFNGFDAALYGGTYGSGSIPGNVATSSSTIGATWTYDFSGQNVFVQFNASYPGIARGNCEIRIDNILIDTITDLSNRYDGVSDSVNNNQLGPDTRIYSGLTPGNHSIEIRVISSDTVVIDRIGVLDNPHNKGIVFVIEVPKITNYSTPGLDQASNAIITQLNTLRKSIADLFYYLGFFCQYIPIMTTSGGLYNLSNGIDDGVHPNNTGHDQIFQTIDSHINV